MSQQLDDLEAVRVLVTTLEKFDKVEQERIIRWAREKLGLSTGQTLPQVQIQTATSTEDSRVQNGIKDLKSFVDEKAPSSDMHFAATVAFYYKFETTEAERKDSISSEILQDASRLSKRPRLKDPGQTLRNANSNGLLDRVDKGFYKLNTVGENLVAMTLPLNSTTQKNKKKAKSVKKIKSSKPIKKLNPKS